MKTIKDYRKMKSENDQAISKLRDELIILQQNRERCEEQIANAIDSEDRKSVETLTGEIASLDIKIAAQERIIDRKLEKNVFTEEELASANNAEMDQYQKEYDTVRAEADILKEQYYKKLIEAGKIVESSNNTRLEYMRLAGIEDLFLPKTHHRNFHYVRSDYIGIFTPDEQSLIQRIDPRGIVLINLMRN